MFRWLKSVFGPSSPSQRPIPSEKPFSFVREEAESTHAETNSKTTHLIYQRNGKVVYEERDGKVITGTPEDKAEGEKLRTSILKNNSSLLAGIQDDVNKLLKDMNDLLKKDGV